MFLCYFLKSLLSARLGILLTPLFRWLKETPLCTFLIIVRCSQPFCNWTDDRTLYRDSQRADRWNEKSAISVATISCLLLSKCDNWICGKSKSCCRARQCSTLYSICLICMFLRKYKAVSWKLCVTNGSCLHQISSHLTVELPSEKKRTWEVK